MKRIIIFVICSLVIISQTKAECTMTNERYTQCKAGYYIFYNGLKCQKCPPPGTSDDLNMSGISACYVPAGTTMTDEKGTFKYKQKCNYS